MITIKVAKVYQQQPGKPKGSIKTDTGAYFSVWPDKLPSFQVGASYEIEFEPYTAQSGKVYNTITTFKQVGAVPDSQDRPTPNAARPESGKDGYWARKEARDIAQGPRIERMATLNSAINYSKIVADSSGQVPSTEEIFKLAEKFQAFVDGQPALSSRGEGQPKQQAPVKPQEVPGDAVQFDEEGLDL